MKRTETKRSVEICEQEVNRVEHEEIPIRLYSSYTAPAVGNPH